MSIFDSAREWAARTVLRSNGIDVGSGAGWNTIISGLRNTTPRLGTAQILEGIQRMPWFKAVNDKVSGGVASVPWMLYVDRSGAGGKPVKRYDLRASRNPIERLRFYTQQLGGHGYGVVTTRPKRFENEDGFSLVPHHAALDLIEHGNTEFPGAVCVALLQQYLDTVGEAYAPMDMNGLGLPTDLWPVPPTWVQKQVAGPDRWWYQVTTLGGGVKTVPPDHMLRMWHPNLADPYGRGRGLGHALGDELETDEYAARHTKAWFYNRARPDVLIMGDGLQPSEIDRLERGWLAKLKGTIGVGRPHFINRKLEVKELQASFKDMNLAELRREERDIIIHVYGVPPEIFGIIENSNRSTIDAADYILSKHVITPRLEFLRAALQIQLVDRYDDRLILDYVSPIEENLDYELDVMKAQPEAFTVDEWRGQAHKAPFNDEIGRGHIARSTITFAPSLKDLAVDDEPPPPDPDDVDGKPPADPAAVSGDPADDGGAAPGEGSGPWDL